MTPSQPATPHRYSVLRSRHVFQGRVLALRSDDVSMPGGTSSQRDVVELPGAVAVVALDDEGRTVMVRQYRHPVGRHLWEVPAGLLDTTTETALEAAERELLEEAGLRARRWDTLVDILTSPGMADETVRVLLARELEDVPAGERPQAVHEEADMLVQRVPLDEVVSQVLAGEIENGITAAAVLAAHVALLTGQPLRPADAAWPARKRQ